MCNAMLLLLIFLCSNLSDRDVNDTFHSIFCGSSASEELPTLHQIVKQEFSNNKLETTNFR